MEQWSFIVLNLFQYLKIASFKVDEKRCKDWSGMFY